VTLAPPPLAIYLALATLLVAVLLLLTGRLSPRLPSDAKSRPYESGVSEPITTETLNGPDAISCPRRRI
jgi:NADH:ubiquinone oxidoreductase subunit 3 (subunit A)